jgi:hypothetical protein
MQGLRLTLEYQVRQLPKGAAVAVRRTAPMDLQALRLELVEALPLVGVSDPEVSVHAVEDFERQGGTGKLRRFLALR